MRSVKSLLVGVFAIGGLLVPVGSAQAITNCSSSFSGEESVVAVCGSSGGALGAVRAVAYCRPDQFGSARYIAYGPWVRAVGQRSVATCAVIWNAYDKAYQLGS